MTRGESTVAGGGAPVAKRKPEAGFGRLRRSLGTKPGSRTVRAGVACYPGQALTPTDILGAARAAFAVAREWPQDRIEVAATAG